MIVQADPGELIKAAGPLRTAADVGRDLQIGRSDWKACLSDAGSERVRTAGEDFLDAWGDGVSGLVARGEALARMLDLAVESYAGAEADLRRAFGSAPDGGAFPDGGAS
jgi:hypothetical protein